MNYFALGWHICFHPAMRISYGTNGPAEQTKKQQQKPACVQVKA